MANNVEEYDVLDVQAEYIAAGEDDESIEVEKTEDDTTQTLIDYFSNNKEAMNLFLAFCFLVQRVNTGGMGKSDLQALNNITKSMVDDFQLDTNFLNYMISSISNNKSIYKLFNKNSSEFNHVQRQHPKRYCEIMSKYLPSDYGFIFTLNLSGVVLDDLKRVESILSLFTKTHITELTAIQNKNFMIRSVNPWDVLLDDYKKGVRIDKNSMVTSFKHSPSQASNIYLIKSLVTARRWLLRRVPQIIAASNGKEVVERLSASDAIMSREEFLGITPTFISFSGNRPYRNTALDSSIVGVRDIETAASDSEEYEEEYFEDYGEHQEYSTFEEDVPVGFLAKTKALFSRKKKVVEDVEVVDEITYTITIPDDVGSAAEHTNLFWVKVEEYELEDIYFRLYRQIFNRCALAEATDNTVDVKTGVIGSWRDVAIGYYMSVSYSIEGDDSEDE